MSIAIAFYTPDRIALPVDIHKLGAKPERSISGYERCSSSHCDFLLTPVKAYGEARAQQTVKAETEYP